MEISNAPLNPIIGPEKAALNGGSAVRPEIAAINEISSFRAERAPVASTTVTLSSLQEPRGSGVVEGSAEPTGAEAELMELSAPSERIGNDSQPLADNETAAKESGDGRVVNGRELSQEEIQIVSSLSARDREVRAHEQAHANAGGQYAGAPSYDFSRGPDGRLYAVGGEVSIDTSSIPGNPQATIDKMSVVIQAANAPAEPSGQDRRVAAKASAIMNEAIAELGRLREEQRAERAEENENQAIENEQDANSESLAEQASTQAQNGQRGNEEEQGYEFLDTPFPPDPDIVTSLAEITEARNSLDELLIQSGIYDRTFPKGSVIENVA